MVKSAFAGKLGVAFVAVALGVCADTATGRIRHMADTYLQSDCSQIIDLGLLATTNMRSGSERRHTVCAPFRWM